MNGIILTAAAAADLRDIVDFVALDNASAAEGLQHELKAAVERLASLPHLGRVRTELAGPHVRSGSSAAISSSIGPAGRRLKSFAC